MIFKIWDYFHLNHFYFKIFIFVLLFILISYYYVILITIHNFFFCLEQWNVCILQHFKDSILRNNYTRRTLNGLITHRIGQHDQYESEINKKAKIKTISNFKGQTCTLVFFFFFFLEEPHQEFRLSKVVDRMKLTEFKPNYKNWTAYFLDFKLTV